MVVLVISAIVISLAITVLNLVQQQIKSITTNFERSAEIRLLERTLYNDFNTFNLSYNHKDDVLICTNPKETIAYQFNHSYVVRNQDTMQLEIANIDVFLDTQKVEENTIDALSITLSATFQNRQLFIFKQKDATYYMNN